MEITVFIEREKVEKKVELEGKTVGQLLEMMKINSETVLVIREGDVLLLDAELKDKDKIKLLSVISGG